MKVQTYEDIKKAWRGSTTVVTYKNWKMLVTAIERAKDKRVFYIGEFNKNKDYFPKETSIKSIHYDKVVSRFRRFVDEYCTAWQAKALFQYKGYVIFINQEKDNQFYLGYVHFHKNSTFKHIADTREEVERCCKNRIDRVIHEKEKVQRKMLTPRQVKIQKLERLQARISAQLEELKKEKDTLTYKGVVLEVEQVHPYVYHGYLKNVENPAPFRESNLKDIKASFESYVDKLESQYTLYCKLTGKKE